MEISERLRRANENLIELKGKQYELQREKNRLNNTKQVGLHYWQNLKSNQNFLVLAFIKNNIKTSVMYITF